MATNEIPALVKHMALAIYESGWAGPDVKNPGPAQTGAIYHCLSAARWRLVEYGYLRSGSQHGPPSNIKLTAKGKQREVKHLRESSFRAKELKFAKLYDLIDTEVENPTGDKQETDTDGQTEKTADGYKAKRQTRLAEVAAKTPGPPQKRTSTKIKKAKKAKTRRATRRW